MGQIATGLRKDFEQYSKDVMPSLLARFKEKRPNFIEDVHSALDAFLLCTNLEALVFELSAGLKDKAPAVKKNTCAFIENASQKTYLDVLSRAATELAPLLMKVTDD